MSAPKPAAVRKDSRKRQGSRAHREPDRRTQKKTQKADGRKSAAIPCVFVSTGGTNGSLRNPIKDACPCSRMIQPATRTAAAGNPSGSSMPILMGPMDRCYGDCLRLFQPEVFVCSSGLTLPGSGSIPSLHRGRRKDAKMAFSTGLTSSIGQVPYAPIPKQLSHEALDTSGKGIPASLKVHPCQADGIPTSIPCKRTKDVLLQQESWLCKAQLPCPQESLSQCL